MIIPQNTSFFNILLWFSNNLQNTLIKKHPYADYFSIQVYEVGNFIEATYHINDEELIGLENLTVKNTKYFYVATIPMLLYLCDQI